MSCEGDTASTKRTLDDESGESMEAEPPTKKQRLCKIDSNINSTSNSNSNSNRNLNNIEIKEDNMNDNSNDNSNDVRTIAGHDRPTHFEILALNCEKMIDFYRKVFNWKFTPMHGPSSNDQYWGIQTGQFAFGKETNKALATYGIDGGLTKRKGMI